MELNEYQKQAVKTAVYPQKKALEYLVLGLNGEAGEVANVYKKYIRSGSKDTFRETHERMLDETLDTMWYCVVILNELGITLEQGVAYNLEKLQRRYAHKQNST